MPEIAEELLGIDMQLRYVLFGLECVLGVSFSGAEWERVFQDSKAEQVRAKQYLFFESPILTVTGSVDTYEPESLRLRIQGNQSYAAVLQRVVEGAKYAAHRQSSSE